MIIVYIILLLFNSTYSLLSNQIKLLTSSEILIKDKQNDEDNYYLYSIPLSDCRLIQNTQQIYILQAFGFSYAFINDNPNYHRFNLSSQNCKTFNSFIETSIHFNNSNTSNKRNKKMILKQQNDELIQLFLGNPRIIRKEFHLLPKFGCNSAILPIGKQEYLRLRVWNPIDRSNTLDSHILMHLDDPLNISHKSFPLQVENKKFMEADSRILKLRNGSLFIISSVVIRKRGKPKENMQMGYHIVSGTPLQSSSLVMILMETDLFKRKDDQHTYSVQKNWSPFQYNQKLHFVYSINPLVIMTFNDSFIAKPVVYQSEEFIASLVYPVSHTNCLPKEYVWMFGTYRGGTPALLVRGQYLAFLHAKSSHQMFLHTTGFYVIGAYTFTNYNNSFILTAISSRPITHESFMIDELYNRYLVVFPLVYYLEDKNGNEIVEGQEERDPETTNIVLVVGLNDADTIILRLHLNTLLDSLFPITCSNNI